jgi:hypothetical protein
VRRTLQGRPATVGTLAAHALLVVLVAGCASTPAAPTPAAPDCAATASSPAPSIRIAVEDDIELRNAPVPASRAERLVFAQLYDTLVRIACDGVATPAIAASWSSPDGLTWRFQLQHGLSFSDGAPLDAPTAAEALSRSHVSAIAAVAAVGDRGLEVRLHEQQDITFFAQPALAVTRPAVEGGWPIGTGAYRVNAAGRRIRLTLRRPDPGMPDTIDVVRVQRDPRSALDAGIDLVVTADPATIAYGRLLDGYMVKPLPWNRTYTLVAPGAVGAVASPSSSELEALAGDAATTGTRAATSASPGACTDRVSVGGASKRPATSIVWPRGDDIARGIAERIAALSWPVARSPEWLRALLPADRDAPLTARAVGADDLLAELHAGRGGIFVVPVYQCRDSDRAHAAIMASGLHAVPLVDARDHLIHTAAAGSLLMDAAGGLRFTSVQ